MKAQDLICCVECNEVYEFMPRKCEMCSGTQFIRLLDLLPKWEPDAGLEWDAMMGVEQRYTRVAGPKWRPDRRPYWIVGAAIMGLAVWFAVTFVLGLWP